MKFRGQSPPPLAPPGVDKRELLGVPPTKEAPRAIGASLKNLGPGRITSLPPAGPAQVLTQQDLVNRFALGRDPHAQAVRCTRLTFAMRHCCVCCQPPPPLVSILQMLRWFNSARWTYDAASPRPACALEREEILPSRRQVRGKESQAFGRGLRVPVRSARRCM